MITQTIQQRIEELPKLFDLVTTSDLQAIVKAISFDSGIDEDLLLNLAAGFDEKTELVEVLK